MKLALMEVIRVLVGTRHFLQKIGVRFRKIRIVAGVPMTTGLQGGIVADVSTGLQLQGGCEFC